MYSRCQLVYKLSTHDTDTRNSWSALRVNHQPGRHRFGQGANDPAEHKKKDMVTICRTGRRENTSTYRAPTLNNGIGAIEQHFYLHLNHPKF